MLDFPVHLQKPDLTPWRQGNTTVPGFTSYASGRPGPHVLLMSLVHGNELAGAIVLDRLLRDGARPQTGTLSFGFANLSAFDRFDPLQPTQSRCVDEDLNRLWDPALLAGDRHSIELDRAREIWAFLQNVDVVLDLHSMLWPSAPLMLSGESLRGMDLCRRIGHPGLIVADPGHASGRRLIDYPAFADPAHHKIAMLLEAGPHWQPQTVVETEKFLHRALRVLGVMSGDVDPLPSPKLARVTHTITAQSWHFAFTQAFVGGQIVPDRNTLIAIDAGREIRTPYDNCLLIMPNPHPGAGHTAVRLAYLER